MGYRVTPLPGQPAFGATVAGLELADLNDPAVRQSLFDLWIDVGVVLFRDGDSTVEMQLHLSRVFGPLVRHFQEDRIVGGHPELVSFSADPEIDTTVEIDGETVVGFIPWHGDSRWMSEPNHGGILRVRRMPRRGGETGFIDLISAYERLPGRLKQSIEGCEAIVEFDADPDAIYRYQPHEVRVISNGSALDEVRERSDFPPIVQPLVFIQPETGRKVLGFSPLPRQRIIGMERQESDALLAELARHVTDESHAYFHAWQPDDLLLWDNLRMLHQACGVPPGEEREVWRTTIAASYPLARRAEEGGFAWNEVAGA